MTSSNAAATTSTPSARSLRFRLADWLGSDRAAEVLRALIGSDPVGFLDAEPDLADRSSIGAPGAGGSTASKPATSPKPSSPLLEVRYDDVWREQVRRLLAACDDIPDEHPRLCRLAAALAAGRLVSPAAMAALDAPAEASRAEIQKMILGDYSARRATAVEQQWADLGRRDRRRTNREEIEANYDERNLMRLRHLRARLPTATERRDHLQSLPPLRRHYPRLARPRHHLDTCRPPQSHPLCCALTQSRPRPTALGL